VVYVLDGEPSLRPQVRALLPPRARRVGSRLLLGVVLGAQVVHLLVAQQLHRALEPVPHAHLALVEGLAALEGCQLGERRLSRLVRGRGRGRVGVGVRVGVRVRVRVIGLGLGFAPAPAEQR